MAASPGAARGARGLVRVPRLPRRAPDLELPVGRRARLRPARGRDRRQADLRQRALRRAALAAGRADAVRRRAAPWRRTTASAKTFDIPSAYWLQAIVSVGTALAAFTIAALLAGAWTGVAAAALVGFYPPLILATGEQLSEPFGAFWLTTAFALFVVAARLGKAWVFGLGGLALGAAVLTRADLLPVPFVLAPLVAVWTWRAAHNLKRGLLIGTLILGGALLAMAPWSVYASQRAHELVPVTRGSSSALFVGTYLPGNGTTVGMKRSLGAAAKRRNPKLRGRADFDLEARSVLAVVADRHPDLEFNSAVALEARKNISRYVREDPVGYAKMMLNKVQRMWSRYSRGGARHTTWKIRVPHIVLVLLAVAGLVAGIVRQPLAAAGLHPRGRADVDRGPHAGGLPGPLQPAADALAARRAAWPAG